MHLEKGVGGDTMIQAATMKGKRAHFLKGPKSLCGIDATYWFPVDLGDPLQKCARCVRSAAKSHRLETDVVGRHVVTPSIDDVRAVARQSSIASRPPTG